MVLGRSQGICGRSWAALRASVGDPGRLSGPLWAVLVLLRAFVGGPGPSWAEKLEVHEYLEYVFISRA